MEETESYAAAPPTVSIRAAAAGTNWLAAIEAALAPAS